MNWYAWFVDPLRRKLAAVALGKRRLKSGDGGKSQMKLT